MDLSPKKVVILFVTLIVCEIFTSGSSNELTVVESDSEETDSDTRFEDDMEHENFVPTKEWQEIKPGQAIPSGLHVKIDLQSGKKEAKLIDEVSHNSEGAEVNLEESDSPHQHGKVFSPDELKEALKLIKNEEPLDKKVKISCMRECSLQITHAAGHRCIPQHLFRRRGDNLRVLWNGRRLYFPSADAPEISTKTIKQDP